MIVAAELLRYLQSKGVVLASVESCTGGLIANEMTNISGASTNFWGSWVVYDNTGKLALGVAEETIVQHGAVSRHVALALAEKGLENLARALGNSQSNSMMINVVHPWKALATVSTTGIAGPGGGSPEKPVGLSFAGIAISVPGTSRTITKFLEIRAPQGLSRVENKEFFAHKAIAFLLNVLQDTL